MRSVKSVMEKALLPRSYQLLKEHGNGEINIKLKNDTIYIIRKHRCYIVGLLIGTSYVY